MVDITQATESPYLTVDTVEESLTKKAVIIDGGSYEKGDFGKRLQMRVNIDRKEKIWNPNRESSINMRDAWGKETDDYVGRVIIFTIKEDKGKKLIIAFPEKSLVTPTID